MNSPAKQIKQTINCAFCRYENGVWRSQCEKCGALLRGKAQTNQFPPTPLAAQTVTCPSCSHENSTWRSQCEKCRASLNKFASASSSASDETSEQIDQWTEIVATVIDFLLS